MPDYTIQNFWQPRLTVQRMPSANLIGGWSFVAQGLPTFKEAPLGLSLELNAEADPFKSPILLISAPGAVGKSTLARQIAFETGAVYVDLAEAEPVGSNTLVGGLVKSGLYDGWQADTVGILIDGLDEARLRVTQEAFEAFLRDVDQLSGGRSVPTVLFGRTGAIQDAWLVLSGTAVLEIGYYGPEAAADFAVALLRADCPNSAHPAIEREAIELLLSRLREHTEIDGDRFAGYAPVLQTVAQRVIREGNASALVAEIEAGAQPVTLNTSKAGPKINEFTGEPFHIALARPSGSFEFTYAELGLGTTSVAGDMEMAFEDTWALFCIHHFNQDGLVRKRSRLTAWLGA